MKNVWASCWGCLIGSFGGLIGLGGVEFRGSHSLAISIPTIAMGLVKYQDRQLLDEIRPQFAFIIFLSLGSLYRNFHFVHAVLR